MTLFSNPILNWYWAMSLAMGICFIICVILIVLQIKSIRWYFVVMNEKKKIDRKREHFSFFCLYGAYVLACFCSIQCLFNHISNHLPKWYCFYGMAFCVILHEAAKTFGYGFFLERAKLSLTTTKSHTFIVAILTKYILPIWISLYFILYSILCPLTFRGLSHNPLNDDSIIPTACLFDEYESRVFYLSIGVEVFNSIFFVMLFAYPLWKIFANSTINNPKQESVTNIIKYNIIFSSVSCISSVTFLLYRAFSRRNIKQYELSHYLWLVGNVDLVINAICTFLMV
eukprot:142607_1